MPKRFDVESIYDAEINPLMMQILAICKEHEIPMIASFQLDNNSVASTGDGQDLWCTSLLAEFKHGDNDRLMRAKAQIMRAPQAFAMTITTREPK